MHLGGLQIIAKEQDPSSSFGFLWAIITTANNKIGNLDQ